VRLGLSEYVEFVDHADDPTEFFSKFHISCLVSSNEGLARVMLESLACATPVISFDVCSAKEVLQKNNCGIVVEMDNYNAFCNEIVQLSGDREKLLEMANNARDCIAKNYNAELVRQKMGELF